MGKRRVKKKIDKQTAALSPVPDVDTAYDPQVVDGEVPIIDQEELETLLGELPESVIEFLKEHCYSADQSGEDEIDIDIDALGDDTLFKLRKILDDFLLQKQKYLEKAEPCEMELHNESGLSNSSLQPCKGNDSVDEDIDIIGGNDPPFSSHTPADIKEDTSCRNSKSSGSNRSSGGSGSSSSCSSLLKSCSFFSWDPVCSPINYSLHESLQNNHDSMTSSTHYPIPID